MTGGQHGVTPSSAFTGSRASNLPEAVAARIRERIVGGDLEDGALLPKQEELLREFGVSKPSLREAMRILESEGLISVRRGKLGGAVVHRPRDEHAAQVIDLILRSRNVSMEDVSTALRHFEPICVSLCASRSDRMTAVIPGLRSVHDSAREHVGDLRRYTTLSRRFHERFVAACGNETIILVIGALEKVWSAYADVWADEARVGSEMFELDERRRCQDDHELLLRLIERGDADAAAREARAHLDWVPIYDVNDPAFHHTALDATQPSWRGNGH